MADEGAWLRLFSSTWINLSVLGSLIVMGIVFIARRGQMLRNAIIQVVEELGLSQAADGIDGHEGTVEGFSTFIGFKQLAAPPPSGAGQVFMAVGALATAAEGSPGRALNNLNELANATARFFVVQIACANPRYIYGRISREGISEEGNFDLLSRDALMLVYEGAQSHLRAKEAYVLAAEGGVSFQRMIDAGFPANAEWLRTVVKTCLSLARAVST